LPEVLSRERHTESVAKGDKRLPDLGLEKDNDGDSNVKQRTAQDKFKCCQALFDCYPVKEGESSDCGGHGGDASSTNEFQNCIHKQEDKNEIRDVARLSKPSEVLRILQ